MTTTVETHPFLTLRFLEPYRRITSTGQFIPEIDGLRFLAIFFGLYLPLSRGCLPALTIRLCPVAGIERAVPGDPDSQRWGAAVLRHQWTYSQSAICRGAPES